MELMQKTDDVVILSDIRTMELWNKEFQAL